jgi:signal transduction histidine kinase
MRDRRTSILWRVVHLHVMALLAVTLAIVASSYFVLNSTVNEFERSLLQEHAQQVEPFISHASGKWAVRLPEEVLQIFSFGHGGYVLAVTDGTGNVIYSSLPDHGSVVRPPLDAKTTSFVQKRHGKSVYYILTFPIRRDGAVGWIEVGQDLADPEVIIDDIVARFLSRFAWPFLILLPLVIGIDILMLKRLLAPVLAASAVASTIGPANPQTRLPTSRLPSEVFPLAAAVNDALRKLESALDVAREFTADAAHELRTPLTILRARVDTETEGTVRTELRADIDAMTHIIDQLLELAELETLSDAHQTSIDLNELCSDIAAAMAPIAVTCGKSLGLQSAHHPNFVNGNASMLSRAIRNLVENAIRHSPPGNEVTLSSEGAGQVSVADCGPGIESSDRTDLFKRFWRKDRREAGHAGLGLAIAARIVSLHRGTIEVDTHTKGGTVFSIVLPR